MWNWFRVCAHCSLYWPPIDLYCPNCWDELLSRASYKRRIVWKEGKSLHHFWLWRENESLEGAFIKARKSYLMDSAHARIVGQLFRQMSARTPDIVLYPTKEIKTPDHASSLAKQVGLWLGVPTQGVQLASVSDYKLKNRKQRVEQRQVVQGSRLSLKSKNVWLVDDVYTTGSTARSIWDSVGKPEHFEIITLVYKDWVRGGGPTGRCLNPVEGKSFSIGFVKICREHKSLL